jgi:hypothetical protein
VANEEEECPRKRSEEEKSKKKVAQMCYFLVRGILAQMF